MGSTEETTTAGAAAEKPPKTEGASTSPAPAAAPPPSSSRESPTAAQTPPQVAAHVFSDWAASLQALYGSGAAAAAAATPHSYFRGTQVSCLILPSFLQEEFWSYVQELIYSSAYDVTLWHPDHVFPDISPWSTVFSPLHGRGKYRILFPSAPLLVMNWFLEWQ